MTLETIVYRSAAGLTPARENYLRALYQLSRAGGGVRLTDLAHTQGVRLPTARHAVDCLRDAGLVQQASYGLINLTDNGRTVARRIFDRFELLRKFLMEVLGVNETAAEREACNMEHHLDEDTLNRIAAFVMHVTSGNESVRDRLSSIRPTLADS
jgi:DtxR family Mn-dependent transcriptional regulator